MAPMKAPIATPDNTESNRSTTPNSESFKHYIGSNWSDHEVVQPPPQRQAVFAAARRARVSRLYPSIRLVIAAGRLKPRSNDMDYAFRAHSAFAWLTGWGSDTEPGSVLVFEPTSHGHDVVLYFHERAGRDSAEFYSNPAIGEFWIGPRPSLAHVAADLGIETREIAELDSALEWTAADGAFAGTEMVSLIEADPELLHKLGARLPAALEHDAQFARDLSELRLIKDSYEVEQLRTAIAATKLGFADVLADLPRISGHSRGERIIEGLFNCRARIEGNTTGYNTIAAAGEHSCFLHWTRNDGPVADGDLVLLDAGVEMDSYYTADITRTFPVSGSFSPAQLKVYEVVLEAADAALAVVRPGVKFRAIHEAAMAVIAGRTAEWGLLPVSAEEALEADNQQHRRYMIHGTSHHLGLDVHDCAQARREMYLDGVIEPGMVFTIEPGLYFQTDDLTVPKDLRGIGVRIEDNILVTADGAENLSISIPRTPQGIEEWVGDSMARGDSTPYSR